MTSNIASSLEIRLDMFRSNLSSVDIDDQEVNGDVVCIEWVFCVVSVVGVDVDTPKNESFRQRSEEEVLVPVRHYTLWYGVDLTVHMS